MVNPALVTAHRLLVGLVDVWLVCQEWRPAVSLCCFLARLYTAVQRLKLSRVLPCSHFSFSALCKTGQRKPTGTGWILPMIFSGLLKVGLEAMPITPRTAQRGTGLKCRRIWSGYHLFLIQVPDSLLYTVIICRYRTVWCSSSRSIAPYKISFELADCW